MTQLLESEPQTGALGLPKHDLAFRLHSRHGGGETQVVVLAGQKVAIGADPQCALRLAGTDVEPCYCLVLRGAEHDVVRSLSPLTRRNGEPFEDAPLLPGDRLRLGPTELEVLPRDEATSRHADHDVPSTATPDANGIAELELRRSELETREGAVAGAESKVAHDREALAAVRREIETAQDQLRRDREAAKQASAAFTQQQDELEQQRRQLELERAAFDEQRIEWDRQRAKWDRECERWEAESRAFQEELDLRAAVLERGATTAVPAAHIIRGEALEQINEPDEHGSMLRRRAEDVTPVRAQQAMPVVEHRAEDDDSIAEYMQSLLQRAGVKPTDQSYSASRGATHDAPPETPRPQPALRPATPIEEAPPKPLAPPRPRPKPPELGLDLTQMREIANFSARSAVETHRVSKTAQKRLNRLLAVVSGGVLLTIVFSFLGPRSTLLYVVVVLAAAGATYSAWRYMQARRRAALASARVPTGNMPLDKSAPAIRNAPTVSVEPDVAPAQNQE